MLVENSGMGIPLVADLLAGPGIDLRIPW